MSLPGGLSPDQYQDALDGHEFADALAWAQQPDNDAGNLVHIGEYTSFMPGVDVAVLTGDTVDRTKAVLANHAPFRDIEEAAELALDPDAETHAIDEAEREAGCSQIMDAIYCIEGDDSPDAVVFSKTGMLAIRGLTQLDDEEPVFDFIRFLDGGNTVTIHEL